MLFSKKTLLVYILYIFLTTLVFIFVNQDLIKNSKIDVFFRDTDIKYKVEIALALDPNTGSVIIPRIFHNKVLYSFDTFSTSVFDSLDPAFLFTLSKNAPLYMDGALNPKMLFPIELFIFILAGVQLIRKYNNKYKKIYIYFSSLFLICIIINGLFLPALYPLKLLPLVILIRTVIFFGITSYLLEKKWLKKYFS